MVGLMAACPRERVAGLMDSVSFDTDIPSKLQHLRQLKDELSKADTVLLSEFLSSIVKLQNDQFSPVRKFVTDIVGEIGSSHLEFLPEIVPTLMNIVEDDAPAVARQAISSGTDIFHRTLQKVATQGLHTSELDDSLESAWAWILKLKDKFYSTAFQESDGRRLLALKFVQAVILIYTPDPCGSMEPPPHQSDGGMSTKFNISWLRRGHPALKVGDLSIEASQSLGLLLDQLRYPTVKSLSTSMVIVLINCLSTIATRRPSFYGRILPVLLGLDPSNSTMKGVHVYGVHHALKNAFLSCLKCTHPSAKPWQDRLIGALRELKSGGSVEHARENVCNDNINVTKDAPAIVKEEPTEICDAVPSNTRRKRSGVVEFGERSEDSDTPGKRIRSMPGVSKESTKQPKSDSDANNIGASPTVHSTGADSGHVQQLVAVFGALVAQGEKAVPSLEILISSISSDLLAEVVILNLKYLPSTRPKAEGDEELADTDGSNSDHDAPFRELSAFISGALSSSTSTQLATPMDIQPSSDQIEIDQMKEEPHGAAETDVAMVLTPVSERMETMVDKSGVPYISDDGCTKVSGGFSSFTSQIQDFGSVDGFIPGLDAPPSDRLPETMLSSSLASTNVDDASQDQAVSSGRKSELDSIPSLSTERSEELSPKATVIDEVSGCTSTATSLVSVQKFVLPKITAPVVDLTDEEKDQLQKLTFLHIVEAYKQVASAGGSQLRCSLLSFLAVEFPLDLDPWTVLQEHILSDYVNNEGHELTLRVLYRLYGEAEEDCDFFSSRTASSVYETFLLKVAETLRHSFPASDKNLSRLMVEVPYLPDSILRLLESLCCPDASDSKGKELHSGDRVTQGLSSVWSLILQRPPIRNALLEIALKSAVHELEEVRMKAIRLVANKLYPLSFISSRIEEFAKEMLLSVAKDPPADDLKLSTQSQKISDMGLQQSSLDAESKDMASNTHQSGTSQGMPSASTSEVGRHMSLYFALCTKKHSLLQQLFLVYKSSPLSVKQAVHSHVPILIRTIGASPTLLEIISDPPDGSDNLLMQVLHTLTDGTIPSPELISTIKHLSETRGKDIEILLPILTLLTKDEVLSIFPSLVNLPTEKFQAALGRLLQGSPSGSLLSPPEALIAIHGIDPEKDGIPLKKVTDACNVCFEQRQLFTQQVVAKVLNQLVEQIPLPLLFMRTVLQAIGAFPALVEFIMETLSRLVSKQIWKYPKLWVGFLKCVQLTQPQSFNVLLQLPPAQLESALNKIPALRAPLAAHADQPNVKSTLPRSVLTVLGITLESQVSSQTQAATAAVVDASGGDKETITDKSKSSSSAS